MVRSLFHPSEPVAIDPRRIAANAGVVIVHVLVFAALMLPSSWEPAAPRAVPTEPVVIDEFRRPPDIIPTLPPPIPTPVVPRTPVTAPPRIAVPDAPPIDTRPVFDSGEIAAQPTEDVGPPETTFTAGPPQLETLAYRIFPAPRYPRLALRAGDEGRVLLRVLVDADGRPQEVLVERSSGHRELDRAARDQVLAEWRFHPAQRDGHAVSAWALVPIDFVLP